MTMSVLVEMCDTWTEVFKFLDNVKIQYQSTIKKWSEEVYYVDDQYKVVIKVKI